MTKHDWSQADAMTDEQIHAAALADPDAQPLTPEGLVGMRQTPRLKIIRRALGLTQEEFATRFQIPLGTLRDWEQGVTEPDQAARAYLKVIAGNPDAVQQALRSTGSDAAVRDTRTAKQPGLDGRHRDQDGEISRKHGNTLVSTLRQTYGDDFAPGISGNVRLSDVVRRLDEPSLSLLSRGQRR